MPSDSGKMELHRGGAGQNRVAVPDPGTYFAAMAV